MKRTIEDILALFPKTTEADWKQHANGGGWKQNTTTVADTAFVEGIVSGNAQVSGDVQVYGNARVCGNAWVTGDAWETSPLYIQGSKHAATNAKYGHIAIGCEVHTFAEWQEQFQIIGEANGYTEAEIAEYKMIIDLFCKLGK